MTAIPIVVFNEAQAHQAYAAYSALRKAEKLSLGLRDNPHWTMLRQDAYERFALAFNALVNE